MRNLDLDFYLKRPATSGRGAADSIRFASLGGPTSWLEYLYYAGGAPAISPDPFLCFPPFGDDFILLSIFEVFFRFF